MDFGLIQRVAEQVFPVRKRNLIIVEYAPELFLKFGVVSLLVRLGNSWRGGAGELGEVVGVELICVSGKMILRDDAVDVEQAEQADGAHCGDPNPADRMQ